MDSELSYGCGSKFSTEVALNFNSFIVNLFLP